MRNKRTLQRGLALLLAGGMALSNLGAVPVLAEEYDTATETEITQTAPEEEASQPKESLTDPAASESTDLTESSENTPATEEEVDSSGATEEEPPAEESANAEISAEDANSGEADSVTETAPVEAQDEPSTEDYVAVQSLDSAESPAAQSNPWDALTPKTTSYVDIDNDAYSRDTVLTVDGKPFWYNGIQIRIDKLKDDSKYACTDAELENLFNIVAEDGYTVVNSQIRWTDIQPNHIAYATDSATVYGGDNADKVYGNNGGVQVQRSSDASKQALTYLKFTLTDKTADEIDGAKIRIYNKNGLGNSHPLEIYALEDDNWKQDTLTWNNAPGHNGYEIDSNKAELVATSNSWDLLKDSNYYDFKISDFIKSSEWAKDGTVSFVIRESANGVSDQVVTLAGTADTNVVGASMIQPQLVYSDAEEYDFTVLDNAIHWATKYGLKFEVLWFGTDTCTISSDSRIPVHAQLNYQPSIGNNGKPLFYKSKADTITGIYNYIMCKNDTGLQAAESTALGTVFNHIATLEDADTVIGCQLTNEPGVGRLHGGIKADHCMCETCLADKGSLGMNATDFRNYTLWNFNNILGAAVKNSKHSVWTRVNLDESSNSTGIVKYNEEVRKTSGANIDFIGIDHYRKTPTQLATEGVAGNTFAQGQNLTMIMELGQKDARDKGLYLAEDVLATLSGGAYVTIYDACSNDGCQIYTYDKNTKKFSYFRGAQETGEEPVVTALSKTNNMLKKIGYDLATKQPQSVGDNQLVFFNADSTASAGYKQQEVLSNKSITFTTDTNGIGIAVNKNENEIALLSTKGDAFTFDNAKLENVVSAELGYYDADDTWHTEQNYLANLTETDGEVSLTVPAYGCVRIVTKPNSLSEPEVFVKAEITAEAESNYTLSEGITAKIYNDGKNGKKSNYLHVTVKNVGDYAEFNVTVPYDGIYRMDTCYKVYSDRPTVQLTADGKAVGDPVDMTKGTSKKWVTTTFGEIALTKGVHTFRYTVTSLATTSGTLPLDFLYLERIDDLVDYSELQALYDEYKDTEKGNYTEDSWNVFQEALSKTKSMLDAQAATKSEVKAQIGLLQQAVDKLEINTDKSKEELYAEYEALVREAEEEIKKTDHYTEENIKKLNDAITTAKTKDLIDQGDPAISASAVATALEKFRAVYAAFKATEQIPAIDKTALQQAVEANTGKQEADYTAESWTAFAKALERARAILADPNALQNDVDAAAKALTDAAAALTVKPTEEAKPAPTVETKVVTDDLSDNNIPDSLKNVGYDTPEKITEKLKLESSKKLSSDNIVVYEVKLQVSKDGVTWVDATAENFPKNGLEISFTLPNGITAETAAQYDFIVSHMKDSGEVELLTPALKDGKLVVTVSSLSPFGISWKRKEQPKPSEEPKPTQAPTATPAPTAAPAASDASSNSSNSSGTTSAPASTAAPKATAAPTAPATVIPQTADSFPLILLAMLALCSAAALTGLVICRKKKH